MAFVPAKKNYSHHGYDYRPERAEDEIERAQKYLSKGYRVVVRGTNGRELWASDSIRSLKETREVDGVDPEHFRDMGAKDKLEAAYKDSVVSGASASEKARRKYKSANSDIFGDFDDVPADGLTSHENESRGPETSFVGYK